MAMVVDAVILWDWTTVRSEGEDAVGGQNEGVHLEEGAALAAGVLAGRAGRDKQAERTAGQVKVRIMAVNEVEGQDGTILMEEGEATQMNDAAGVPTGVAEQDG